MFWNSCGPVTSNIWRSYVTYGSWRAQPDCMHANTHTDTDIQTHRHTDTPKTPSEHLNTYMHLHLPHVAKRRLIGCRIIAGLFPQTGPIIRGWIVEKRPAKIRYSMGMGFHRALNTKENTSCWWTMECLRLVGSLKIQVSFAEYSLFYRALLQKRPVILRSLLTEATP